MPPDVTMHENMFACTVTGGGASTRVQLEEMLAFFDDGTLWCYFELTTAALVSALRVDGAASVSIAVVINEDQSTTGSASLKHDISQEARHLTLKIAQEDPRYAKLDTELTGGSPKVLGLDSVAEWLNQTTSGPYLWFDHLDGISELVLLDPEQTGSL
jgi:hypothetical protein